MAVVYLSPSSQCYNIYAYANTSEAFQMRKIATKMQSILQNTDAKVILAPINLNMEQRIKQANQLKADYYISLHSSSSGESGAEFFYAEKHKASKLLCENMYNRLTQISKTKGKGVTDGMQAYGGIGLAEIKMVQTCPVVLKIECHSNKTLAKWICNNTQEIANALAKPLVEVLKSCEKC